MHGFIVSPITMNRRFFIFTLVFIFCFNGSAKELEGIDVAAVHKALNAKLTENCFESADEKLNFLKSEYEEIQSLEIGDEASLIATSLLKIEMETVKTSEALRLIMEKEKGKKNKSKISQEELNPEAKEVILGCYEKYKDFAEKNENLSSYFYFHYNETLYATVPYLAKKEQLKIMTGMLDDYKKLEEINPDLAETLNMYGAVLWFLPGAFGGSKKSGEEKIQKAIKVAACDYEKANALVLYAQLLLENKESEKAAEFMNQALELSPENLTIKKIRDANNAGYSIFKMEDYEKGLE